jgi:1-acyl-sn-glycerol-3-phosphate acyltransferase
MATADGSGSTTWLGGLSTLLKSDLDPSDLGNRDPKFIREVALPFLEWMREHYFRVTVEGLEAVPTDGSFIAVANHSGGPMLPDCWVMLSQWWSHFGVERPSYAMVHDAAMRMPGVGPVLAKMGAIRASAENAGKALELGGSILVYPGGELDCLRSFRDRNRINFFGRTGFIKLAIKHQVPIVPVVNAGGHEVYFTLFSSRALARWTGIEWATRVKTVPLNLGLPWGLWLTGFVPFLPLPAKLDYKVGKPIRLRYGPDAADDPDVLARAARSVAGVMQNMLDDLAARRRFPVIG